MDRSEEENFLFNTFCFGNFKIKADCNKLANRHILVHCRNH